MIKRIACFAIAVLMNSIADITALDDALQKQEVQQYRVKTELMEVRAVVTDKQGRIVENLQKDDFELLENNHPQTISFFSVSQVESKGSRPAATKPTVQERQDKILESTQIKERLSEPPVRTTLLCVDNLHLSITSLNRVKQALRRFIDEQLTEQDMVALATSSGSLGIAQQFTRNRQLLRYGVEQIRPGSVESRSYFTPTLAARVLHEQADLHSAGIVDGALNCPKDSTDPVCLPHWEVSWNVLRLAVDIVRHQEGIECPCSLLRSRAYQMATRTLIEASYSRKMTLSILGDFAAQMIGMPGKRMIVIFSDGFTIFDEGGITSTNETQSAINRAVRSGVAIYSIDAKGLQIPATVDAARSTPPARQSVYSARILGRQAAPPGRDVDQVIAINQNCPVDGSIEHIDARDPNYIVLYLLFDPACSFPDTGDLQSFVNMSEREEESGLSTIAEETGGKMYTGSNNLSEELGRAFDANRFYYVLSHYLSKGEDPGKFRTIKVKIRNHPEYIVRTARGYLPSDIMAKQDDEPKTPRQRLLRAIRSPLPATGFNVSAQADYMVTAADNDQVTLTVYVDGDKFRYSDQDQRKVFGLEMLYAIYDSSGKQVVGNSAHLEGNLTPERLAQAKVSGFRFSRRLSLKPGAYQARVGVREEGTDLIGTASAWIEVPELARDKLGMSGLILRNPLDTDPTAAEGMNVSELEQVKMVQGIPLYAHNDFCDYEFRVYRDKLITGSELLLKTEVLQDGKPLKEEQWKPISAEDMSFDSKGWFDLDGEVDLGGFKSGVYELRVSIKDARLNKTIQRAAVFGVE
jgi:VWFA-related protein